MGGEPELGEMKALLAENRPWKMPLAGEKNSGKKLNEGNLMISWPQESPGREQRLALDRKQHSPGLT